MKFYLDIEVMVGDTACMNLKKLAKKRWKTGPVSSFL